MKKIDKVNKITILGIILASTVVIAANLSYTEQQTRKEAVKAIYIKLYAPPDPNDRTKWLLYYGPTEEASKDKMARMKRDYIMKRFVDPFASDNAEVQSSLSVTEESSDTSGNSLGDENKYDSSSAEEESNSDIDYGY